MKMVMKGKARLSLLVMIILAGLVLVTGCASEQAGPPEQPVTEEPEVTDGLPPAPVDESPPQPGGEWTADGVLGDGEYSGEMDFGSYEIRWLNDGEYVYFGIRAETRGWLAVGLEPAGTGMRGADLIFGLVQDGTAVISDQFSTGTFGPHSPDVELGGSDDIVEFGGREEGDFTTIEFKRRLVTGDEFDNELSPGLTDIIWSYGQTDNINLKHVTRGYGEIRLE